MAEDYIGAYQQPPQVTDYAANNSQNTQEVTVDTENIDSIFVTTKQEEDRTTFDATFKEIDLDNKKAKMGNQFIQGLIDNKPALMDELGLSDEEYDALSILSLALASQETGMGLEKGYVGENTWYKGLRLSAIFLKHQLKGTGSASSGLTQLKINDFINNAFEDDAKLYAQFVKFGLVPEKVMLRNAANPDRDPQFTSKNNLYKEPDKAAIGTMIVLANLVSENYDTYLEALTSGINQDEQNDHESVTQRLNDGLTDEERVEKGLETISDLKEIYETLEPETQEQLRAYLKNWLLSYDGSTDTKEYRNANPDKDETYFEDMNLNKMNEILKDTGFQFEQNDLDYIRFALTNENQAMTMVEYAAYAWNNGTGYKSMQVDRLIAEKIGTIFPLPENYSDEQQFCINVESLADKYAQMANASLDDINYLLEEFNNKD